MGAAAWADAAPARQAAPRHPLEVTPAARALAAFAAEQSGAEAPVDVRGAVEQASQAMVAQDPLDRLREPHREAESERRPVEDRCGSRRRGYFSSNLVFG